ncbi:MAG: MarR family transcriptional regulator [Chitinophagales bacterium]|nr:MarR family transcriptional regulator [Chitinophagales bacterium]
MIVELLSTGSFIDHKVNSVLKEYGITHVQFNILRILQGANGEALSPGVISDRMLFKNSDVTRLMDRLEKRALISRNICPENRRKMDIRLEKKGLKLISDVLPKIESDLNGFFKDVVSPKERDQLLKTLSKIQS